jgi:hypothetical protein
MLKECASPRSLDVVIQSRIRPHYTKYSITQDVPEHTASEHCMIIITLWRLLQRRLLTSTYFRGRDTVHDKIKRHQRGRQY